MSDENEDRGRRDDGNAFVTVLGGTVFLALFGFGLSLFLDTPLGPQIHWRVNDVLIGVIATLPLVIFLWWFSNTDIEFWASFRRSQIEFFSKLEMRFTPFRILLLAIGAGISEELLFRGVLQTWLLKFAPLFTAILVSNMVFGFLHMRTMLYAFIAGLVGAYLGFIYYFTQNLLTPITTHFLYDAVALEYSRRAISNK